MRAAGTEHEINAQVNWLTRFMKHRLFPGVFQWAVLLMLLFTAYTALFTTSIPERNFALVFVWIFWGTVAPISVWLFGRFWCAMCPFHMLGDFLNKIAGPKKAIPRWVRQYGFWVALALFIAIVWFEHAVNIFQSASLTLLLLVPVLVGTVVGALLYRNEEFWCHGFCPLLPLARNYSMLSMVEVRADNAACEGCSVKSCYRGDDSIGGCPVGLYLRNLDSMQECIACGQCFRACPTSSALSARFRRFFAEFRRIRLPRMDAALFASIWPGALAIHYFTLVPPGDQMVKTWMQALGMSSYVLLWTLLYVGAIVVSLAIVAGAAFVSSRISGESFKQRFSRYAYSFIPLAVGIHTAFNMPRFFGQQGLNRATHNLLEIFGYTLNRTVMVVGPDAMRVLMYSLLAAGLIASLMVLKYIAASHTAQQRYLSAVPEAAGMIVFTVIIGSMFRILY